MQRPIKFRAWDISNKRMGYFLNGFLWDDEYNRWNLVSAKDKGISITDIPFTDNIILMQYIGIDDKNGQAIYEGDTVLTNEANWIAHVKWNINATCFYCEDDKGGFSYECDWKQFLVLGNIYENTQKPCETNIENK